ncbi:tetracycline resistance MFS efflux pump [Chitinimonas naiadis]
MLAIVAIDALAMAVVLPLLPFYSIHLGASPFMVGALFAAFSLCQFLAGPVLGRMSDRYGRKRVLLGSQIGMFISLVLLALAQNLTMVFVARMLSGLSAGNLSVASAYAVDRSTPATRKQAIGIVSMGVGIGLIIGPTLSTFASHLSHTAPIWIAAGAAVLSIIANLVLLTHELPPAKPAMAQGAKQESLWTGPALAAFGLLAMFYLVFSLFVTGLALFLGARFTWDGHAFGPAEVGVLFALTGAVSVFTQLVVVKAASRLMGDGTLIVACFLALLVAYAGLGLSSGYVLLGTVLVLSALATSLLRPTLAAALSATAPSHRQGEVMGLNQSLMAVSNIIAPLLGGLLIDHHLYGGWAYTAAAGAGVAALAAFFRYYPVRSQPQFAAQPD